MKTGFFQASSRESKRRKREVFLIVLIFLVLAGLTLLELRISRGHAALPLSENIVFFSIINTNILLILLLIFLILRNVVKLLLERRRRILGARLRTKLVAAFVVLSIIPTALLFYVSWFFISRSMEMWVHVQVESALEGSLAVGQGYYKAIAEDTLYFARQIVQDLRREMLLDAKREGGLEEFFRMKLLAFRLDRVALLNESQGMLAEVTAAEGARHYPLPEAELIQQALDGREVTRIRSLGSGEVVEGLVPLVQRGIEGTGLILAAWQSVPDSLVGEMAQISESLERRKQINLYQRPFKSVILMALIMVTLLILFSASWFGFYLAKEIATPLQLLANGIGEVAAGNFDHRIEPVADDELGILVDSYNRMIDDLRRKGEQVRETQATLRQTNIELEQRRRYMEILLRNVGAGVTSLDQELKIRTVNRVLEDLFRIRAEDVLGRSFDALFAGETMRPIRELVVEASRNRSKTLERRLWVRLGEEPRNLSIRAGGIEDEEGAWMGVVMVFEDDTELIRAQRAAAWREVARRIAHEIKNPLTPIQLSAQRLQKRYASSLREDGKVFEECTSTIIRQVEQMKNLVNEFSHFARMPAAKLGLANLNEIAREVLALYQQAHRSVAFRFDEDAHLPLLLLDPDQIRRVLVNLLDNAVAAVHNAGHIALASRYDAFLRMGILEVADDGCGIPEAIRERLFEPYTSTKKGGTGLGLAIVKSIVSDHNGYVRVKDNVPRGTKFVLEFPIPPS
ncbi:MAG: ATP-binding protein [bacterium]